MGFKSDREFLRNISIGAVGTRQVAAVLNRGGFQLIELERYCCSNKIWATKIKRLRVPDLLCLKTGIRIESRGKSNLEVTMSHAVNNPDRAWDKGLRDTDLIAFIRCIPDGDAWRASERVALFKVGEMRATAGLAGLSRMKAASEGSEIRLTWPSIVPSSAGVVTAITADKIETRLSSGRKQTYRLGRKEKGDLTPYVTVGSTFGNGDSIIASAMPTLVPPTKTAIPQYDFLADLESDSQETDYVAVKALGFLPNIAKASAPKLSNIMQAHADARVRLEAAASLARLNVDEGNKYLSLLARDANGSPEFRMEVAFILTELTNQAAKELLAEMAATKSNDSELRAAATWGLSASTDIDNQLELMRDSDEVVAVHAIAVVSRLLGAGNCQRLLEIVGREDRQSAGIVRSLLSSQCDFVTEAIQQAASSPPGKRRQWLLYLLAAKGRATCEQHIRRHAPDLLGELEFFWAHHVDNWTNRLDVADQIDFLEQQLLH